MRGFVKKMVTTLEEPVRYMLPLDEDALHLNPLIGSRIRLEHLGNIYCQECGRASNKSYSQGYCYPCFKKLPQCDLCMMSPERCHFAAGTCRDDSFGETFCMQSHVVYLANSSGLKVGITKHANIPTRWIDQGAVQAIPMLETQTRQIAGFAEVIFKQHISDRTQWQRMLKSENEHLDLVQTRAELLAKVGDELNTLKERFGSSAFQPVESLDVTTLRYPVDQYPTKVSSLNLDKTPIIEGTLMGIKGQYLILDIGVINIRKYTSYEIELTEISPGLF